MPTFTAEDQRIPRVERTSPQLNPSIPAPTGISKVALYDPITGQSLAPIEGWGFMASCTIAVADTTAADSAIFSIKNTLGTRGVYITDIFGSLIFNGTATSTGKNGIYFERHNNATPTGGTAIAAASRESTENTVCGDIQFKVSALTVTGLNYDGARFGRYTIPISASGVAIPFYVPTGRRGIVLEAGEGLAMKLTYQAVVGLFVDLNVHWIEI